MKVSVEEVSPVKRVLEIEIPQETIVKELDKAYKTLKKQAKIKGFRPGKAPRSVLERLYKKDVNADVSSKLLQETFVEALQETKLDIVGRPEIDPPDLDPSVPYVYKATVEVKPAMDDIDFSGLTLKKTRYEVSDEEIEVQLKMLQKNLATQKAIEEDRGLQDGDYALIDYEGFVDGKPHAATGKTENFVLKIGQAVISDSFDEQLKGMRAGEEREFEIEFPQDYKNPELAGRKITFHAKLNEIREEILPPIDDEFAKRLGNYTTLEEVRQEIRKNLENGYAKRTDQELNEQVFSALLERVSFELPQAMVDYELEHIIADTERSFASSNMRMEDAGLTREGLAEQYRETAEKQVPRHQILDKIIEQEKLEVSDEEMAAGFDDMAKSIGQPVEQIKAYYDASPDKIDLFKHTLLEKKAIELIIDSSKTEEVDPQEETPGSENDNAEESAEDA
jgi:trigger factor